MTGAETARAIGGPLYVLLAVGERGCCGMETEVVLLDFRFSFGNFSAMALRPEASTRIYLTPSSRRLHQQRAQSATP